MAELEEDLTRTFGALGDPTRRAILQRLKQGPATVTDLARPFRVSLNAVSKHIRVLERAGLLQRAVRGREHWCSLDPRPLQEVRDWTEDYRRFWEEGLEALAAYLESGDASKR